MFESLTSFVKGSLWSNIVWFAYIVGTLIAIGIVVYFISALYVRKKNSQKLTSEQEGILRYGRLFVGVRGLRHLYISSKAGKSVNVGDIKGVIFTQKEDGTPDKTIVGVRKDFKSAHDFYMIDFNSEHAEWKGDVYVEEWNFVKTGDDMFLVPNTNSYFKYVKTKDAKDYGVDTLRTLQLSVQNAILANAYHRIRIREKKLIKNPEEYGGQVR